MRLLLVISSFFLFAGIARAEMVQNNTIGSDLAKEKLCASRANSTIKGKIVPFEIDSNYVERARSVNPDVTFIAIDGISPQLVECYLRQGTGKYEPASFSPEQGYWHVIKKKHFEPGINTPEGISKAANVCLNTVPAKINRPNFDHSVYSSVIEINRPGTSIAGKKAERYDIAIKGSSFYKSSEPDLVAVNFTCLLSPMLDVKAIQLK